MQHGDFIWTDLSTYRLGQAQRDYAALFDWTFVGGRSYRYACIGDTPIAGMFEMPKRLAKMKLPSFWMSYIRVDDLKAAIVRAKSFADVIEEVAPQPFNDTARIALLRDPSGAGFTLYQGPDIFALNPHGPHGPHGQVVSRYYHAPDIAPIIPFYAALFEWTFEERHDAPWPLFDIRNKRGALIAHAEQVPESIRGTFSYWMPCFHEAPERRLRRKLAGLKGEVLATLPGDRQLIADRQQAHFMVTARGPRKGPWN